MRHAWCIQWALRRCWPCLLALVTAFTVITSAFLTRVLRLLIAHLPDLEGGTTEVVAAAAAEELVLEGSAAPTLRRVLSEAEAEDEAELVPLLVALVHETLEGMLAELLKTTSAHWERY